MPLSSQLIHWHSDNFLLFLPRPFNSPFEFFNQLREIIAQQLFTTDTITCSVGLASWQKGITLQDNVEGALMGAKAVNKNTVKVA